MISGLPKKLKHDAILEAVLDVRFEVPDSSIVEEVLVGRLADIEEWRGFRQSRLPSAGLPAAMRKISPEFRYQPSIEMVSPDGGISVRVGPEIMAYSRRGAYPGWEASFRDELFTAVDRLFGVIPTAKVTRLGLRYINALTSDLHGIVGVGDISIKVNVAQEQIVKHLNLNFLEKVEDDAHVMSRIATIDLASGNIPATATVIVDIDVFTPEGYGGILAADVRKWISSAHDQLSVSFFKILGKEARERLREE